MKRLQAGHGEWTDSMAPVRSFDLVAVANTPIATGAGYQDLFLCVFCFSKISGLT